MNDRKADARLDGLIYEQTLRDTGVVEDDEPTEWSHRANQARWYMDASGEFTPEERMKIRAHLGLGPFDPEYRP